MLHKDGLFLGADGQIILKHNGLCVHMEYIIGIFFENDEQSVEQVGQTVAEKLKRLIPFSVPMGV